MLIARTLAELRTHCTTLRERFGSLALVPTMGAFNFLPAPALPAGAMPSPGMEP